MLVTAHLDLKNVIERRVINYFFFVYTQKKYINKQQNRDIIIYIIQHNECVHFD